MLDIDKIIVLENKEKYLILNKTVKDFIEYYYIAKVNSTETDIENNYKLITVENENGNMVILEVTGEERLREILPLFSTEM